MKILVADDLEINRMLISSMLEDLGSIDLVENGSEAVAKVQTSLEQSDPYDLICLDIEMPVLDGLATLLEIRNLEKAHNADRSCIIMVTASSDPEQMLLALENEGCDDFVVKPVMKKTLRALIEKHGLLS